MLAGRLLGEHDLIVTRQFSEEKTKNDLPMNDNLKFERRHIDSFFSNEICWNELKKSKKKVRIRDDAIYIHRSHFAIQPKIVLRQLYNAKWKEMPSIDIEEETKKKSWS